MARTLIATAEIDDRVRIVHYSISFEEPYDDIIIEVFNDGEWQRAQSFNSISNDYAHTAAYEYAKRLTKQLPELI
jgi:hypothetical protein